MTSLPPNGPADKTLGPPTLEQANETVAKSETAPVLPELDAVQAATRLRLRVQELAQPNPQSQVDKVFTECQLREKEPPSRAAILEVVGQYVLDRVAERVVLETMVIERTITDSEGNVVAMDVKLPLEDGSSIIFAYVAEGRHGLNEKRSNEARVTSLEWTSWDADGMPETGGNIADYKDGNWVKRY